MDYIIYMVAGLVAGILTGLVGLSAAVIIAPIFATFLGMDPYIAIGIALASDVFASGFGAVTYYSHKNIDLKRASILTSIVVFSTIIASILSYYFSRTTLHSSINIFVFILGLRFLVFPVSSGKKSIIQKLSKSMIIQTIIWGSIIGFISGFFGSGGGLSILAFLTMVLHYDIKKGVGTSLFVMTFTAFIAALVHIIIGGTFLIPLVITAVFATLGSIGASYFANRINEVVLSRVVGSFLLLNGIALILTHFL
jgi:uncharacterized membrane protein YfcA